MNISYLSSFSINKQFMLSSNAIVANCPSPASSSSQFLPLRSLPLSASPCVEVEGVLQSCPLWQADISWPDVERAD